MYGSHASRTQNGPVELYSYVLDTTIALYSDYSTIIALHKGHMSVCSVGKPVADSKVGFRTDGGTVEHHTKEQYTKANDLLYIYKAPKRQQAVRIQHSLAWIAAVGLRMRLTGRSRSTLLFSPTVFTWYPPPPLPLSQTSLPSGIVRRAAPKRRGLHVDLFHHRPPALLACHQAFLLVHAIPAGTVPTVVALGARLTIPSAPQKRVPHGAAFVALEAQQLGAGEGGGRGCGGVGGGHSGFKSGS